MYKNYILFKRQWKTNLFIIVLFPFFLVLIPNLIVFIIKYCSQSSFPQEGKKVHIIYFSLISKNFN